jgi:zinc and cadmium transporter
MDAAVILYSLISVFLVSLLSFLGLFLFTIPDKHQQNILIHLISLAAGALFGDVFIHLLPEIANEQGFTLSISLFFLGGVLLFFILEKVIHGQHYHHEHEGCEQSQQEIKPVAYMSLIVSSVHNFIDGLVIAAAYFINIPAGIGTTLAVGLHEIPHEIGSFTILLHGGFTRRRALLLNFLSALSAVVGALIALSLGHLVQSLQHALIPVAAGGLLYIAGSDLIPELHRESSGFKSSLLQIAFFILGIGLMLILLVAG